MSTNETVTANDVAQITKNADACEIEAIVWSSIARNALGEEEANEIYQSVISGVMADIDETAANTDDDETAAFKSFGEYVEAQRGEKLQMDGDGAPVDYGDYEEANEGRQVKEIDGDLYLEGDSDE